MVKWIELVARVWHKAQATSTPTFFQTDVTLFASICWILKKLDDSTIDPKSILDEVFQCVVREHHGLPWLRLWAQGEYGLDDENDVSALSQVISHQCSRAPQWIELVDGNTTPWSLQLIDRIQYSYNIHAFTLQTTWRMLSTNKVNA